MINVVYTQNVSIKNLSKHTVLAENAFVARSILRKSIGLIGSKTPRTFILDTRWGIHTFFMRFPIDVLILDKQYKIVNMKKNIQPNRFFFWNPKYDCIIELSEGIIEKTKTETGDIISFG